MMMITRRILSLAAIVLLASGCREVDLTADVSLRELASGESRFIVASLVLPQDCESKDPDYGVEAVREEVMTIFPNATFIDCDPDLFSDEGMMRFEIPLAIDRSNDNAWSSDEHINLLSFDNVLVGMYVPKSIAVEIYRVYDMNNSRKRLGVTLRVTNDTGKAISARFQSVYVDGVAVIEKDMVIERGRTFDLTPGNVQVDLVRFATPSGFVLRLD